MILILQNILVIVRKIKSICLMSENNNKNWNNGIKNNNIIHAQKRQKLLWTLRYILVNVYISVSFSTYITSLYFRKHSKYTCSTDLAFAASTLNDVSNNTVNLVVCWLFFFFTVSYLNSFRVTFRFKWKLQFVNIKSSTNLNPEIHKQKIISQLHVLVHFREI